MVDKIALSNDAVKAYLQQGQKSAGVQGGSEEGSFATLMRSGLKSGIETMQQGEEMAAKAVTGEASTIDVVTAVNKAETTLNTIVAIRDRLISAYQEIQRMQI